MGEHEVGNARVAAAHFNGRRLRRGSRRRDGCLCCKVSHVLVAYIWPASAPRSAHSLHLLLGPLGAGNFRGRVPTRALYQARRQYPQVLPREAAEDARRQRSPSPRAFGRACCGKWNCSSHPRHPEVMQLKGREVLRMCENGYQMCLCTSNLPYLGGLPPPLHLEQEALLLAR